MLRTERRSTSLALGACALVIAWSRAASAYCIATTCDQKKDPCATANGCVVEGAQLHWSSRCLSFGTQKDGSKRSRISYQQADDIIQGAFEQWIRADCGEGRTPSFQMWDLGAPFGGIECSEPEFNPLAPNANVWMFRDDDWPYEDADSTLALTSTVFDKKSGALLDADVEINSHAVVITTSSTHVDRDLVAIVTHEAGHFLGLAHSQIKGATMFAQYNTGDLDYRSLHPDDVKAICALYPPDRDVPACTAPTPPHGFSRYCGGGVDAVAPSKGACNCRLTGPSASFAARRGPSGPHATLGSGGLLLVLLSRRRLRR